MSAEFEQIVAGLRAEGGLPVWPEERATPRTGPVRPHRPEPTRLDRTDTERPDTERPESDRADTDRAGADQAGADQAGAAQPEPGRSGLDRTGLDRTGPGRAQPPPPAAPEDDHFVPPDPPPMPPLGQAAAVGVALLALGVLLVVSPDLLGLSEAAGMTLGLVTLAGGLGWLVLRSWSTDPPDDVDPTDDGARF
jgi:hypothetical protein